MTSPIENMRIHFYGVQGSGSTFPSSQELDALQDLMDYEILKRVFEDLAQHIGEDNRLDHTLTDLIGGPIDRKTLLRFRKKLDIPRPRIYGGWTTCIHVETSEGSHIVLDCGSGFRNCARDLQMQWDEQGERHLHVFGSHSHSDHTTGFDQAAVCFDPRNTIHIYGNYQFLYSLDSYLGIFSKYIPEETLGVQTPINYSMMPANFEGIEIVTASQPPRNESEKSMERRRHGIDQPVEIGSTRITAFEVFHPAPCLAYRIEHGGKSFVFCTDHERRYGPDPDDPKQKASEEADARLWEHTHNLDVLYRDGQYLRSDYDGLSGIGLSNPVPRLDWGHSCLEDVQEMAEKCGVKQTYIGHHDPNREWSERNWIDESLARSREGREDKIELARAGTVIDL
ncbi:MBL fold metallo-hydrolase [Acidobacteriota bacterium]